MADGKQREAWCHTSSVLAMLVNVNRAKDSPAVHPNRFNPYTARAEKRAEVEPLKNLRELYVSRQKRKQQKK